MCSANYLSTTSSVGRKKTMNARRRVASVIDGDDDDVVATEVAVGRRMVIRFLHLFSLKVQKGGRACCGVAGKRLMYTLNKSSVFPLAVESRESADHVTRNFCTLAG